MKSLFSSVVVLFVTCILAKQDNVLRFESQKKIAPEAEFLHLMIKEIRLKQRTEPWITSDILEHIQLRDKLLYQFKKSRTEEDYSLYRKARNQVQYMCKSAKSNYFNDQVEENRNNPKNLWNQFKKLGLDHSTRLLGFNWKDCGNSSDSIAHVTSLSISPDPLELTGNIDLKVTGNIVSTLSQNLTAALTIKKKVAGIPIEIPCVDNVGSCTYTNICGLLNQITECPKFLTDHGIPCKCPLYQGDYKLPNTTIPINLPAGPPGGDYDVTAILTDVVKQKTACLHVEFTLE